MREKIEELRKLNYNYRQIKEELHCSKSTISYYLGEDQKTKLRNRTNKYRGTLLYHLKNTTVFSEFENFISNKRLKLFSTIQTCKRCGINSGKKSVYCIGCKPVRQPKKSIDSKYLDKKIKEVSYNNGQPSNYTKIRSHARVIIKRYKKSICENCGYDKYVECCHKKAISAFSKEALINEVNHIDNLIYLCPNCHWEFDKGLIFNN